MNDMNLDDIITKIKYFKIERIEHGSTGNMSQVKTFAYTDQRCPIAVSIEFADDNQNSIPVTKAWLRERLRLSLYPFAAPIHWTIATVFDEPNEFEWDEAVIDEVQALNSDVDFVIKMISGEVTPERIDDAVSQHFSVTATQTHNNKPEHGAIEYITSRNHRDHKWEKSFLRQAVEHEATRRSQGSENPGLLEQQTLLMTEARMIVKALKTADPTQPITLSTLDLGPRVLRRIDGVERAYIQRGDTLYEELLLRNAVDRLIIDHRPLKEEEPDPPRLRQRIVFYLSHVTTTPFQVAATFFTQNIQVSTTYRDNPNDDGYGQNNHLFNSAVKVIPVIAYRPDVGHPGLTNVDDIKTGRLRKLKTSPTEPEDLEFYESYIEFMLGHRPILLIKDVSDRPDHVLFNCTTHMKDPTAYCSFFILNPSQHKWSEVYDPRYFWIDSIKTPLYRMVDLATEVGGMIINAAKGRINFGTAERKHMNWSFEGAVQQANGSLIALGRASQKTVAIYDLYGVFHLLTFSLQFYTGELFVERYKSPITLTIEDEPSLNLEPPYG